MIVLKEKVGKEEDIEVYIKSLVWKMISNSKIPYWEILPTLKFIDRSRGYS